MDNNRSDFGSEIQFVNKFKICSDIIIGKPKLNRPEYLGRVRVSSRLLRQ